MIRRLAKKGQALLVDDLRLALAADVRAAGGVDAFAAKHRLAKETIARVIRRGSLAEPGDKVAVLYGLKVRRVVVLVGAR